MTPPFDTSLIAAARPGLLATLLACLGACQAGDPRATTGPAPAPPVLAVTGVPIAAYLDALDQMAPGDTTRQQAALFSARAAWQQSATPTNTLRYALVLGTPGHDDSNPLEASRLLAMLLVSPELLSADELRLAAAFQREFTARVSQYAELARARMESEAGRRAAETEHQARINALSAELARARRDRDSVQQKLDAIADIERTLMERDGSAAPGPEPTPP